MSRGNDEAMPCLDGIRVLVVDDEPDLVEMFDAILTIYGAEVRSSTLTSTAMEILSSWHPDILVSDLSLPDDSGFAFIEKIRKLQTNKKDIPAIALSGLHDAQRDAINAGFSVFMNKPVDPDRLLKVILQLTRNADIAA